MSNQPENVPMEATEIQTTPSAEQKPAVEIPEKLTPQQALQVLVDVARIAQAKGILALEDAEIVAKAVKVFTVAPAEAGPQPTQG